MKALWAFNGCQSESYNSTQAKLQKETSIGQACRSHHIDIFELANALQHQTKREKHDDAVTAASPVIL